MTTSPWIAALDTSSVRLLKIVHELPNDTLGTASFTSDWTIAQVLSHLDSGAEICTRLLERAQRGDTTRPSAEENRPVWERWGGMSAAQGRDEWYEADQRHREMLFQLDSDTTIEYFVGPLDVAAYAGYRLSEQAVHGWDVEVALNPEARVAHGDLLWARIDLIASRFHDSAVRRRLAPKTVVLPGGVPEIDEEVRVGHG